MAYAVGDVVPANQLPTGHLIIGWLNINGYESFCTVLSGQFLWLTCKDAKDNDWGDATVVSLDWSLISGNWNKLHIK